MNADASPSIALPCPLWRRIAALVYDLLAVLGVVMVVGLLCQLATGGQLVRAGPAPAIAWWYQPLQGLVVGAYFVASWLRGGQTLGMRPWRIRLVAAEGRPPVWGQAVLRAVIAAAPLALLGLEPVAGMRTALWAVAIAWVVWFGVAAFDRRRRALHDIAAGTELRFSPAGFEAADAGSL